MLLRLRSARGALRRGLSNAALRAAVALVLVLVLVPPSLSVIFLFFSQAMSASLLPEGPAAVRTNEETAWCFL